MRNILNHQVYKYCVFFLISVITSQLHFSLFVTCKCSFHSCIFNNSNKAISLQGSKQFFFLILLLIILCLEQ